MSASTRLNFEKILVEVGYTGDFGVIIFNYCGVPLKSYHYLPIWPYKNGRGHFRPKTINSYCTDKVEGNLRRKLASSESEKRPI